MISNAIVLHQPFAFGKLLISGPWAIGYGDLAPLLQLSTAVHDVLRIYDEKVHPLTENGFTELNEEICETVDDFLEHENVPRIAKYFVTYIWDLAAPAGYLSSSADIPAVFRLKLSKIAPMGGWHCVKPDGYFSLYAKQLRKKST